MFTKPLHIWFPAFYTEYHREHTQGLNLVRLLELNNIVCHKDYDARCQGVFVGGFLLHHHIREHLEKYNLPIVHYCWDIYPFQVETNPNSTLKQWWKDYIDDLKDTNKCESILVPSKSVIPRVKQYTNREAMVITSPVHPWETPVRPTYGNHVLNVMRDYPTDPNRTLCYDNCKRYKIPLIESRCQLDWEDFKKTVVTSRFLISPYYEASTGGMTLLEGYWHGKPCLLSNSPMMGASDYFGKKHCPIYNGEVGEVPGVYYFQHDDLKNFRHRLLYMWNRPDYGIDIMQARNWLTQHHSEEVFASKLARHFMEVF